MSKKKNHGTQHHIIPKSRGGPKDESWNIIEKNSKEHRAWHILFYNLLPCEAIHKINTDHRFKYRVLKKKHTKSWQILFRESTSREERAGIVKKNWMLTQCFKFKICNEFHNKKVCPFVR